MQVRTGVFLFSVLVAASLLCSAAAVFLRSRLPAPAHAGPDIVSGLGVLKSIDAASGSVLLKHQAITSLGMPAMTMSFPVGDRQLLMGRSEGERVVFTVRRQDGTMALVDLRPLARPRPLTP